MRPLNRSGATLAFAVVFLAACSSCAERDAQRAVQSSLTGLAHGVEAADRLVAEAWPAAAGQAREQVLSEREQDESVSVEDGMRRYDEIMDNWTTALNAMRAVREALFVGQAAFDVWLSAGSLPESWAAFCLNVEVMLVDLLDGLSAVGVDVPPPLRGAPGFAGAACEAAKPWLPLPTPENSGPNGGDK